MPELPEAETIVRDLRRRVHGATVARARVARPDILVPGLTPRTLDRALAGLQIAEVTRRAKNIVFRFERDARLLVNLGMTGRLVVSDSARAAELRHVAARIELTDGRAILYDDVRRFGRFELHTSASWPARDATLGVEPLSEDFTADVLYDLTQRSRSPIRTWLLDQRRVSGVGNIYANEALYRAGIRPDRPADSLTRDEAARLRDEIRAVLQEAIDVRGTTLRDYRDAQGEAGGFEPLLRVYDRAGEPCGRCGTTIRRLVITNRSAFYCPTCQPRRRTRRRSTRR